MPDINRVAELVDNSNREIDQLIEGLLHDELQSLVERVELARSVQQQVQQITSRLEAELEELVTRVIQYYRNVPDTESDINNRNQQQ